VYLLGVSSMAAMVAAFNYLRTYLRYGVEIGQRKEEGGTKSGRKRMGLALIA
jgi:hypothetical protein